MSTEIDGRFGERLREERERLGLTQSKLAAIMTVKPLTLIQYEKELTKPNLRSIYLLKDHGFNLQYLIFGRENVPKPRQIPDHVITSIASSIKSFQSKISGGPLDEATNYRLFLILLEDYFENPNMPIKTGKELIELVVRLV